MRHAQADAIKTIEPLLARIRALALDGVVEKKPGTFYRRSAALLHFHEDAAGMFADVKVDGEFQRIDVTKRAGQDALIKLLRSLG